MNLQADCSISFVIDYSFVALLILHMLAQFVDRRRQPVKPLGKTVEHPIDQPDRDPCDPYPVGCLEPAHGDLGGKTDDCPADETY